MKHIIILISLFLFVPGQTIHHKCGIIPEHEPALQRESHNWGYGYDSLLVDLERWGESPYVTIDSIGASVQNRALWELTISENPELSSNHRVYIHARTHPGEEESFWVTNEIINLLLSDSPFAEFVRENCVFHIIPMYNPDGVELGFARENANGVDIESGWDDEPLEPEVAVLKNRFIELMTTDNPVEVALNMHSAYLCTRYFVFHDAAGTSEDYAVLEQQFISGIQSYFSGGFENWDYFVSWTSGTPDQYPESWWWMTHGESVMALTYEDMNCEEAGLYDSTAYAMVRGICDYIELNYLDIAGENGNHPTGISLHQNYPNPFNPITTLRYDLPEDAMGNITITDMIGRLVKTLINGQQTAGYKSIQWNAINNFGEPVSTGLYLYTIQAGEFKQTKKMVLLR